MSTPTGHTRRVARTSRLRVVPGEEAVDNVPDDPHPPPAGMAEDAAVVWREVAPLLVQAGRWTIGTRHLLELYSVALSTHRRAAGHMNKTLMKKGQRGEQVKDPKVAIARDWTATVAGLAAQLGVDQLDGSPAEGKDPARLLS